MATLPITKRGAEKLKEELQRLKTVERPAVIAAIAEARAQGDLSENAEYEAAEQDEAAEQTANDRLIQVRLVRETDHILLVTANGKAIRFPVSLKKTVAAGAEDAILCDFFARNAVHAAMAGKTGLVIGFQHDKFTHVPIELLAQHKKRLDLNSPAWFGVLAATGQKFAQFAL